MSGSGDPNIVRAVTDALLGPVGGSQVDPHPARAEMSQIIASWISWDERTRRMGGPLVDLILDGLDIAGFDIRARSAVVRPTRPANREEIGVVVRAAKERWERDHREGKETCWMPDAIADALLAEFWPGTPEPPHQFPLTAFDVEVLAGFVALVEMQHGLDIEGTELRDKLLRWMVEIDALDAAGTPEEGNTR